MLRLRQMTGRRRRRTAAAVLAGVITAGGVWATGAASAPNDHPTVVYVVARSGSMGTPAGACGTRLACVKAAIATVNDSFRGRPSVAATGLAISNASGAARDVDLGAAGTQLLVRPQHDGNRNRRADIVDAAQRLSLGGATCYTCGLDAARTIAATASNPSARNLVVFISDRPNQVGPGAATLAGTFGPDTVIRAIAVGPRTTCGAQQIKVGREGRTEVWVGTLAPVAALTPGGSCVHTSSFTGLARVITAAID